MKLDYSQFKKVHEDKDSATLMHPKGHQIKIAKTGLSKQLKAQLDKLPMHLADGGDVQEYELPDAAPVEEVYKEVSLPERAPAQMPQEDQMAAASPVIESSPNPVPQAVSKQAPMNYPINPNRAPNAVNPMGAVNQGLMGAYSEGFGLQQRGIDQQAKAQAMQAEADVKAADTHDQQIRQLMADHQQKYQALDQEIQHTIKDIDNSHIDPSHYINSKSTLGKVSTAIGLLLGGIGGGLTHQENPALRFLNAQIDRDVDAQKAEVGKKENVLNAYYKQLGNMNDALAMTKAFYTDLYANEIRKAAAKAQSPMAQAQANQALGQLQFQKTQVLSTIANSQLQQQSMDGITREIYTKIPEKLREKALEEKGIKDSLNNANAQIATLLINGNKASAIGKGGSLPGTSAGKQLAENEAQIRALLQANWKGPMTDEEAAKIVRPYLNSVSDNHKDVQRKVKGLQDMLLRNSKPTPILNGWQIGGANRVAAIPNANEIPGYKR
jgi:hypothetical protein